MKIITYGLRYSDYAKQRELFALRNNGEIRIVAEIGYEPEDPEIFSKRMTVADGLACDHDMVIVCSGTVDEARNTLKTEGVDVDDLRFEELSALTAPHFDRMRKKHLDILRELVSTPEETVRDRDWLKERFYAYGFFPFFKLAKEPQKDVIWSTSGILQVPDEFVDFCLFLLEYRFDSAIEIGVAAGSSSYIMAALMYRHNPDMLYHMVDINDCLVDFDRVREIIPSLRKDIPKTSDDFAGEAFDFCFIDADHSYDGMMRDWMQVGRYTRKLAVTHDIYGHEYDYLNGGTVRGWREIKEELKDKKIREFSLFPDKWMGIGTVVFS